MAVKLHITYNAKVTGVKKKTAKTDFNCEAALLSNYHIIDLLKYRILGMIYH